MTNNTEQQAVPVAQINWRLIAKSAGEHGVRYRTNTALLAFLDAIEPARKADRFDPALPCKSGEGADHGLGPHATVVDDCEDGFMSVAIVVGENVYLAQGGEQITMSREQFAQIAKSAPDATQTREAELSGFLEQVLLYADPSGDGLYDGAGDIAGVKQNGALVLKGSFITICTRIRAALNARGGA